MSNYWPEGPWCPLFGGLPKMATTQNTFTGRCVAAITEARFLLGIKLENYCPGGDDYPPPATINHLVAENTLLSARAIHRRFVDIYQYAQRYGAKWIVPPPGAGVDCDFDRDPDQIPDWILYFGQESIGFVKGTPDHVVFAVLAIAEAAYQLSAFLHYDDMEGSVVIAQGFLSVALRRKLKEDMEKAAPFIETGRKVREGMARGGQESARLRSAEANLRKREERSLAIELWGKNPGWTVDDMAKHIYTFQEKNDEFEENARKVGTIKNNLKGVKTGIFQPKQ